jgi:hypothetical protein
MLLSSIAVADPIKGRDTLKFSQQPMLATPLVTPDGMTELFGGHNEPSTAYSVTDPLTGQLVGYQGQFMADDFADTFSTPVVHVKWWGSYIRRPAATDPLGVRRFLISFEEDIPAEPGTSDFSRPGKPLLNQIVTLDGDGILTPASGTFTERDTGFSSVLDGPTFEYNAELHLDKHFKQEPNTVYWLKIVALVDVNPNIPIDEQMLWGWHNRDYTIPDPLASTLPAVSPGEHIQGFLPAAGGEIPIWHFQDDSVNGFVDVRLTDMPNMPDIVQDVGGPQSYFPPYDGPSLIGQYSKDLAFELYTVPEPSTLMLGVLALVGLAGAVRRNK